MIFSFIVLFFYIGFNITTMFQDIGKIIIDHYKTMTGEFLKFQEKFEPKITVSNLVCYC